MAIEFQEGKGIVDTDADLKQQLHDFAIERGCNDYDEFMDMLADVALEVWSEVVESHREMDEQNQTDALINGE